MRRTVGFVFILLTTTVMAVAASEAPPFPKVLINAKYAYVTAYDGDQFNPNLLPADRQAIVAVQDALAIWRHYVVVYRPEDADLILMVESRPSEDVLAVYDARGWPRENYLWRLSGPGGLEQGETPLVTELEKAVEKASH